MKNLHHKQQARPFPFPFPSLAPLPEEPKAEQLRAAQGRCEPPGYHSLLLLG